MPQRAADTALATSVAGMIEESGAHLLVPVSGAGESMPIGIEPHESVFWLGDLNYRIDEDIPVQEVFEMVNKGEVARLQSHDQLNRERGNGRVFQGFREGPLLFAPTYKYQVGTSVYEQRPEKKLRAPAWCDRVLWKARDFSRVELRRYSVCSDLVISDHKPVSALFACQMRRVHDAKRRTVLESVTALLDKRENESLPKVQLSASTVSFGTLRYSETVSREATVTNTGETVVYWRFVPKDCPDALGTLF